MNDAPSGSRIGSAEHTRMIPTKRMAASVVFTDLHGRMLLCEPSYKDVWEVPGGAVESGESPRQAAVREVEEELGLVIAVGRLLALDWVKPVEKRTEALVCVYDGGMLEDWQTAGITLDAAEIQSWAWCSVEQARQRLRPVTARRVIAAMGAEAAGVVAELHHGHPTNAPGH